MWKTFSFIGNYYIILYYIHIKVTITSPRIFHFYDKFEQPQFLKFENAKKTFANFHTNGLGTLPVLGASCATNEFRALLFLGEIGWVTARAASSVVDAAGRLLAKKLAANGIEFCWFCAWAAANKRNDWANLQEFIAVWSLRIWRFFKHNATLYTNNIFILLKKKIWKPSLSFQPRTYYIIHNTGII